MYENVIVVVFLMARSFPSHFCFHLLCPEPGHMVTASSKEKLEEQAFLVVPFPPAMKQL